MTDQRRDGAIREQFGKWVVVIPQGIWTICYGYFETHDECCEWIRANGWHPADANIHPVRLVPAPPEAQPEQEER